MMLSDKHIISFAEILAGVDNLSVFVCVSGSVFIHVWDNNGLIL